jgi:glycosyltransferase involved in cell wall biosynthesis
LAHDSIDLEELAEKYEIQDKIEILGRQGSPILDIIYYACDIFCLPSYTDTYPDGKPSEREGIPVALMEAMAWGKPVIATDHAGNSELVEKILVKEKDVNGLASAIEYLLDNKDKWEDYGKRNLYLVEEKFSKSNIDVLIKTLDELQR